jgi:ligand-binding sensor domain-containing protein
MRFMALVVVGAISAPFPLTAQAPTRDWRPEDRVVVGDFSTITSVAAASDRIYATSPDQLLVRQAKFREWEGTVDPPDPALLRGVFVSLADPLDNSLWLARPNAWVHYEPNLRLWTSGAAPGRITGIAFDLANPLGGLLLRTAGGWFEVSRGGVEATAASAPVRPLLPVSAQQFLQQHPSVAAMSSAFLLDGRMAQAEFTAAAQSFDRQGWYLGTAGAGLFYLQEGAAIPERLPFGVLGPSVTALFAAPGGIWTASERTTGTYAAMTYASSDLRDFRYLQGPPATGLPFGSARRLVGMGRSLWLATDQGLARMDPGSGRVEMIDRGRGLPDSRVYDVTSRQGWIGVATAHGAARVSDSLEVFRVAPDFNDPAYAVSISADTTWIGTAIGIFYTVGRTGDLLRPSGTESPEFREPVLQIAWLGDTLVALAHNRLFWRDSRRGWHHDPEITSVLGELRSMRVDGPGVWLAGEKGFAFSRLGFPVSRVFGIGDIPADARDVAVDADYIWVATGNGLVRFAREAIRP